MKVRLENGEVCVLQSSGELVQSDDALSTCTATWFVYPFDSAEYYAPTVSKSTHPVWTSLYCDSVSIKKHGTGAIITATYEGSSFTWDSESDSGENTIEVSCTMREEPIESHPKFEYWAGTPATPNCGIFDEDGKFTGWNSSTEGGKIMAGVKSYLVPSYAGTISLKSSSIPSLSAISTIGTSQLPAIGGGREWLCTGISYSTVSDGTYSVSINYLSSGENGWNKYIYE